MHPSATAGDGRYKLRKTPKPGDPEKNLLSCWQCGYTVVPTRDNIPDNGAADPEADGGNTLVTTTVQISNDQSKLPIHLRGMATFAATSRDVVEPVVNTYCPLCGSPNPRGLGDELDFAGVVDLSDQ